MDEDGLRKHRSKCRIIADILHAIQESNRPRITYLIHEANLSYGRMVDYLEKMETSGLVEKASIDEEAIYRITPKGSKYLDEFRKFEEFGEVFGVEI